MTQHPALEESFFKEIPQLPASRVKSVSRNFNLESVKDFSPAGDRAGKSISWATISKAVMARDNYACRVCGKSSFSPVDSSADFDKIHFQLEVHHIIPRKDGGSDTFQNLITLCEDCHHKTFSNGYSGVPTKERDLFSFEQKIFFALPPETDAGFGTEVRQGFLEGYDRVFDQTENRYRVVPVEGSRMQINIAYILLEEYRGIVSRVIHEHDVSDFITLNAQVSGLNNKVRFLIDSSSDLLA